MHLGFILFDYFPYGGLQRDCLKIARICVDRGHQVTLFARTWQGDRPDWIEVQLLERKGWSNISRNRHFLKKLSSLLRDRPLDGVVGFNKMPGLDLYYGADPCYSAKVERLKPWWYRWLPRYRHFRALEEAVFGRGSKTHIMLLVPREIPLYQKFYGTEDRFTVLPPGIARVTYSEERRLKARTEVRLEQGWPLEDRLLLFVGSGFRTKGLDRVIRGLAALPEFLKNGSRLAIIGQNKPGRFALLAQKLGVRERVHFLGGRNDVFDFLLAGDLLLHPAYSEAAGMILLEALTAGLPVIATDVCGYSIHIEKAGAGRVLPSPFSQEELNKTVEEFLVEPQSTWRNNGLKYSANEDLYSCHQNAVEIIEKTAQRKTNRSQHA